MSKHISDNIGGFISFETLSKLQKFKAIEATPEEIQEYAKIRSLTKLKLNPEGTSIARIKRYIPSNKKNEVDENSIYAEGLTSAYKDEDNIYKLFEQYIGPVSFVRIPEDRNNQKKFFGFCFVEFFDQKNVFKAVELMDNNEKLTKMKLRVMSKSKWNEYEQEYLALYEERKEHIKWLWRENTRKGNESITNKGIIAFVQNLHPKCPKTTATELLQTSGVHITYMTNKKKGLDSVHVRLENPEEAQKLEAYFKEHPTIQETEKDKIGKASENHGIDTLKVRILQGKEEELYWENDISASQKKAA
ncbi:unnamed protein product [Rhizopus stolonifer]